MIPHVNGFAKLKNGTVCENEIVTKDGFPMLFHEVEREHMRRTGQVPSTLFRKFLEEGHTFWGNRFNRDDAARTRCGSPLFGHTQEDLDEMAQGYAEIKADEIVISYGYKEPKARTGEFYLYDVATLPNDWDTLPTEEQRKYALNLKPTAQETPSNEITRQVKKSMFISGPDLIKNRKKPDYIVEGLARKNDTGVIFGESGNGKTFNVISLALAIASETPWAGRKVKKGLVFYFLGEGSGGFPERIIAGCKHYGINDEDLSLLQVSTSLIDLSDTTAIVEEITAISEQLGEAPAMIIIDTLARHIDGDENSTPDMTRFINYVDRVKASFPGCVAVIVHHPGHGDKKRSRGSYALKAAADFEARVDAGKINFLKVKDGELPPPLLFKLIPVETGGHDDNGKPYTSCAVTYGECSERHQEAEHTMKERLAIQALIDASARSGQPIQGKVGATVEDWRQSFYAIEREQDPDTKQGTMRQAFNRAAESLAGKGVVLEDAVFRILADQRHQDEILTKQTFAPLADERYSVT